jgi:asparaginyl-tRNA synthetase
MKTTIKHITAEMVGTEITLSGWIQNIRSSGKVAFIELRDGTGYLQCVAEVAKEGQEGQGLAQEQFDIIANLGQESALSLT